MSPRHPNYSSSIFTFFRPYPDIPRPLAYCLKLTTEYVGSFMGERVQAGDVFVCGTADQGDNVLNAIKAIYVPSLVCAAQRLNTSVMWAL